jgi:hypothetical protein
MGSTALLGHIIDGVFSRADEPPEDVLGPHKNSLQKNPDVMQK